LFSMSELIDAFTVERIGKAGTKFDIHKAQWFNQQYLRAKPDDVLAGYLIESLQKENITCSQEKALQIAAVMKERATFPSDLLEQGRFFFESPTVFDEQVIQKKWNDNAVRVLSKFRDEIATLGVITADVAKTTLDAVTAGLGIGTGKILQAVRVSLTGGASGPDLMRTMEILGKEEVIKRIDYALSAIQIKVKS